MKYIDSNIMYDSKAGFVKTEALSTHSSGLLCFWQLCQSVEMNS